MNMRMERIERLLKELEYEVVRGMMEGDVEEELTFNFIVPVSKKIPKGIVMCQFKTRPDFPHVWPDVKPGLRVIK